MAKNKFSNANIFDDTNESDDNPFKSFSDDFVSNASNEKPVKTKALDVEDIFSGEIPVKKSNVLIPLEDLIPAPEEWNFYPPADNETIMKMMESFAQYGQLKVAIVRDEGNGKYMIIGGHNRFNTLRRLNAAFPDVERYKSMRCNVYSKESINDEAFRIAIIEDNEAQRAKEDSRYIAVGYNVRKHFGEKSSIYKHGLEMRKKLMEKYNISNGTASNIEQIGKYLIQSYFRLYINGNLSRNDALVISRLDPSLQEYLYKNAILKLSVQAKKKLKEAKTIEDVDHAIYDEDYFFDGIKMSSPTPKENLTIKLSIPKENLSDYLDAIIEGLEDMNTEESKIEYTKEILLGYKNKLIK